MANVINSLKLGDGTYVFTTPYATCDTPSTTVEKVATITPGSNFSLETGARVAVKFTNGHATESPTLNVNNTGAKPIYFKNAALVASNYWSAGQIIDFIYDGTNWVCSAVVTDNNMNTAHSHIVGVGLKGSGNSGVSGVYAYQASLKDEAKNANDSLARPAANANRLYPVEVDNSGYLAVTVPWNNTDTKNTAGSTDTSDKIFLIGATSQAANPKTYSHDTAYVGTDGCLYSNSQKVATLEGANEFTGSNSFTTNVAIKSSKGITTQGSSALQYTEYNYGKIIHVPDATNSSSKYTLTLPTKSGTIALTSDIPSGGGSGDVTAAGNNIFTGTNQFNGGTSFRGSSNYFVTAEFMAAASRPGDPVTTIDANGVHCTIDNSVGTYYQEHQILHQAFTLTLPSKSGTLATTSDIPIKTATLSGTTLSITLS